MSSPFSMIVVATRTSYWRATKSTITFSSSSSPIWPWPTTILASGTRRCTQAGHRVDRLDAVVHEVDLAAALELVPHRVADHLLVEGDDVGLDRQAVARRRLDHRHVADADQRHVERARNRRRAHRQHVDLAAHLLDALLVGDAEALLLVDDQQPEIVEDHVLRQQAVRPDDDVQLAFRQVGQRDLLLGLRAEPADHVDLDRERREA